MHLLASTRARVVALVAALLLTVGVGVAVAGSSTPPPSNAVNAGRGMDQFGMTKSYFRGHSVRFTYTKGFWCDRHIKSAASSKCEAGKKWRHAPAKHFDPLYITVPLGFNEPMNMDCPSGLVCVDHPGTIDLSRLEPALKPLYPQLTDAQLTAALKNYATPGHQHFITDKNGGKPEWWDVRVVGVTDKAVYKKLDEHKSAAYLLKQVKKGNTTAVIPTNLFLYFGVK